MNVMLLFQCLQDGHIYNLCFLFKESPAFTVPLIPPKYNLMSTNIKQNLAAVPAPPAQQRVAAPPVAKSNVAAAPAPQTQGSSAAAPQQRLPTNETMTHAVRLAISQDKPILLDYWENPNAKIGIYDTVDEQRKPIQEKLLLKSEEEFTSPIVKFYKCGNDFIIITENSIYLVVGNIKQVKINRPKDD